MCARAEVHTINSEKLEMWNILYPDHSIFAVRRHMYLLTMYERQ